MLLLGAAGVDWAGMLLLGAAGVDWAGGPTGVDVGNPLAGEEVLCPPLGTEVQVGGEQSQSMWWIPRPQ